jgi:hypothetical protein
MPSCPGSLLLQLRLQLLPGGLLLKQCLLCCLLLRLQLCLLLQLRLQLLTGGLLLKQCLLYVLPATAAWLPAPAAQPTWRAPVLQTQRPPAALSTLLPERSASAASCRPLELGDGRGRLGGWLPAPHTVAYWPRVGRHHVGMCARPGVQVRTRLAAACTPL